MDPRQVLEKEKKKQSEMMGPLWGFWAWAHDPLMKNTEDLIRSLFAQSSLLHLTGTHTGVARSDSLRFSSSWSEGSRESNIKRRHAARSLMEVQS